MQDHNDQAGDGLGEELRDHAERVTVAAAERLHSEADSRKGKVAEQAHAVSSALGNAAETLGGETPSWFKSALEQGAKSIEQLAHATEGKDSRQLVADVQQFAQQRPGSFLAGCALLGFAAARVFKAGGSQIGQGTQTPVTQGSGTLQPNPSYGSQGSSTAKPMMAFTDGGGTASPVSPQNVGSSL